MPAFWVVVPGASRETLPEESAGVKCKPFRTNVFSTNAREPENGGEAWIPADSGGVQGAGRKENRSEGQTSELQPLTSISYAVISLNNTNGTRLIILNIPAEGGQ